MGLRESNTCCFCFDTKAGCLILASLSLAGSLLSILLSCNEVPAFMIEAALDPWVKDHNIDDGQLRVICMSVVIAVLTYFSLAGLFSILLIHGIRKDRPRLMLPYLVQHKCIIVLNMLMIVIVS